ncbi:hypothetical protein HOLleu_00552 [Holothuria leucospilota]|uniref:P2X purinoreceptor 7 intracellular domain-containing protein n=1 Tax=Holothuria leucospilota TaxID=206669 RepID=A0A9Q1HIS2_HOLLE|nr:hypothetical protein HOLleu_00552 [Holothuria leucospilota]
MNNTAWCRCSNCNVMPYQLECKCCTEVAAALIYAFYFPSCRTYRYAAYRMFTYWVYGKLGQGVRKVVPACAVSKIRETFPDPNGVYVGFQIGDDGVEVEVDEVKEI